VDPDTGVLPGPGSSSRTEGAHAIAALSGEPGIASVRAPHRCSHGFSNAGLPDCPIGAPPFGRSQPRVRRAETRIYESHFNGHRPHRALNHASPLRALPDPVDADVKVIRRDRLGGLLHEYAQFA
jgi:hypothetical protein